MDRLDTERLTLRLPTVADAEAFWPYVSDPELPYYMTWEAHRDIDETRAFLRYCEETRAAGTTATWAIFEQGGALVGLAGLHDITRNVRAWRKDVAELGYWIAPPLHGRGYMTEAARAVVDAAFTQLGLHKVIVGCLAENVRSKRVIEKLGFRFVGVQRDHAFRHDRWWNHLSYELTEPEWAARLFA
jgi:ribosomal-protein-alanine N-acetyltransferase